MAGKSAMRTDVGEVVALSRSAAECPLPDDLPKALRHTCRVLIDLWENGESSRSQVAERTGLTKDQVSGALSWLCRKGAVKRWGATNGSTYEAVEDPPRNQRPKTVRTKSQAAKTQEQEDARRFASRREPTPAGTVRYAERKLAMLERMLPEVRGADRDLFMGVVNDYRAFVRGLKVNYLGRVA